MESPILQEFSFSLVTDCHLLVQDLADQKSVPLAEVISLGSQAEALYVTATLESRALGKIADCRQLWVEVAELFGELCDSWTDIKSGDPSVAWLRGRLHRLLELCRDRTSLYNISEQDRSEYAERRSGLPDEGYDSQPEPVREFSRVEVASIEHAYRQCLSSDNGSSELKSVKKKPK